MYNADPNLDVSLASDYESDFDYGTPIDHTYYDYCKKNEAYFKECHTETRIKMVNDDINEFKCDYGNPVFTSSTSRTITSTPHSRPSIKGKLVKKKKVCNLSQCEKIIVFVGMVVYT